ncbi:hypothetical protein F4827_003242 [Paraburkholderia bannensis]|uniref:Transposase n=1 Tax=Paraburkholderia bannensis TaxID=765414 RepID=A0A7W9TXS9_9BURK|nr:hypothetical protein [Paraburkholderia sp. WP4_3_2]MBB6103387.1 hypothetical protein [Paraburkholderia bannensis]
MPKDLAMPTLFRAVSNRRPKPGLLQHRTDGKTQTLPDGCVQRRMELCGSVSVVYQQTQRWIQAGCFEAMVNDLRSVIRVAQGLKGQPGAVILDGRTLQSSRES